MTMLNRVLLLAIVIGTGLLVASPVSAQEAPSPRWLRGMESAVEQVRTDWGVPGMAVGVVTDSALVYAYGSGVRNVETDAPVTEETLFPIASATKAFTAAALGTLHDEGQIDWTLPVREYLPRFRMHSQFATQEATVTDLLSHRTGIGRISVLRFGKRPSRAAFVDRLHHLEPSAPFRTTFQYSNMMYMMACYLAGQVAGTSWETLVRERLFGPLGMNRSVLSVEALQRTDNYARPYAGGRDSVAAIDYRRFGSAEPAGAVVSSVDEMASWVRLFLNEGAPHGQQVIDRETVRELTQPRIVVENYPFQFATPEIPQTMYAFGWFVQSYRGHRLLHHLGTINGFSTLVGMMPSEEVGWVILTNKDVSLARFAVMHEIIDRRLGHDGPDWNRRVLSWARSIEGGGANAGADRASSSADASPTHTLSAYVGTYHHPGYGDLSVTREGDRLVAHFGAFRSALRHLRYNVFDLSFSVAGDEQFFSLQFQMSRDGTIDGFTVPFQAGAAPVAFTRKE